MKLARRTRSLSPRVRRLSARRVAKRVSSHVPPWPVQITWRQRLGVLWQWVRLLGA